MNTCNNWKNNWNITTWHWTWQGSEKSEEKRKVWQLCVATCCTTMMPTMDNIGFLVNQKCRDNITRVSSRNSRVAELVLRITYIYIHVNPPSFVRSLRHFGIAENLRPGDENLRHLTFTSILKKLHRPYLVGNQQWKRNLIVAHFRHFVSPRLRSDLWLNAWLHPTVLRVLVPDLLFAPWWREHESSTFLRLMFHQRRCIFKRSRIVSWQSRTRSPAVLRVAVMPWQLCVDFSEAMGGANARTGEHPFEFGSAVLTIYVHFCTPILAHAAWQRTFSMRNNAGKVLSDILSQWLNVSWTTYYML